MSQSRQPDPGNHLIREKSPYLLAHAHNPVDWYPWSEEAFDKARQEQKPVLLSIGYSTCHWCHVMAHESFEDEGIAHIINEHFVAIKVDREERPDIDHIYMTATTSMTGQGGWPLTVFLTPAAEPFYGGTYFPPHAKWGSVGFVELLNSIAHAWKTDRKNILDSAQSITETLKTATLPGSVAATTLPGSVEVLKRAFEQLEGQFDPAHGGFGSQPKFPMGHNLSFLLRYYKRRNEPKAFSMVGQTLTAMAAGGIWDHLGGGFHRYSTDNRWHIPHFEKMLYDQALLSRAYIEAFQASGNKEFAGTAEQIFEYVLRDMRDKQGGFYSAEDADSLDAGHLREGAFYVFEEPEIMAILGKDAGTVFCHYYGVKPNGNADVDPHGEFLDKNILYEAHTMEDTAVEFQRQREEIQDILVESRNKLLAYRNKRPRPGLDDKILVDWNGLMIASLAFGGCVLGKVKYIEAAKDACDFILSHMVHGKRLWHRWRQGESGITAGLEDYAFFFYGLLEVYEATFEQKYLESAKSLADTMIEFFSDKEGGFYMTASDAQTLIIRPKEIYDGALPSGNSVAALGLLKLFALTGKEHYQRQAETVFGAFGSSVAKAPYAYCFFLSALDWHLEGPVEIKFQGPDLAAIAPMKQAVWRLFIPDRAMSYLPSDKIQAQVCRQGTCSLPVNGPDMLEKELTS